ncbi:MAG: hypothetical protein ABUK11_07685 [Mariprofundaceae bacterium]
MQTHPLIRHPVGRMSAASRWYLAGIAMLALILIAIHFAIQVYAQQEAKRLVSSWAGQAGFSVSDVRYRMLRGALTLVDVRFQSEHLKAYAPTVFLHGNLSSLSSEKPQATRVEFRGAEISLTGKALQGLMKGEADSIPDLFHQLWTSSQRVGIYQTKLKWLPQPDDQLSSRPTVINLIRLESAVVSGERNVEGLAHWLGGEMELVTHTILKDGPANVSDGSFSWKGLGAAVFLDEVMNLSPLSGSLSGNLMWKQKIDDHASYVLSGRAEMVDAAGENEGSELVWNGSLSEGEWKGDVKSVTWPLAMFSNQLPDFQHYRLSAGRFDGVFNLVGNLKQWQMHIAEGELSGIQYHRPSPAVESMTEVSTELFPKWHIEALHVSGTRLQWPDRNIYAKEMVLRDANFIVDSRGAERVARDWNIEVKEIIFNQITPAVRLAEGLFYLPMLEGKGSLKSNGRLQLKLKSSSLNHKSLAEGWRISGSGMLAMKGGSQFRMDIRAKKAALVRFRPFMPETIRRDASDISGDVNLKLNFQAGTYPWEGSGRASITDAHLQHAGEQWHAKAIKIEFDKIGSNIQEQQIHQVEVLDWHYQAALRPLSQPEVNRSEVEASQSEVDQSEEEPLETEGGEPSVEKVESAKAESWHIQNILLSEGLVSAGHSDAVWADNAEVRIRDLRPGVKAPVEIKARLGGGSLTVKGTLDWNRAMPELHEAKILVRDTLPFLLNNWLTLSSIPHLIRGRVYADISLQKRKDGAYKGLGYIRLQHGVLGSVLAQNDPLLTRVGFNTHDILTSLQEAGRLRFRIPFQGEGSLADVMGSSLIHVMKKKMEKQRHVIKPVANVPGHQFSSIRLHARGSLSQNERVRLRKVIRYMLKNPKQEIELEPQLSLSLQDDRQIERVRYTQKLIEGFLTHRGISRSRIFPVWPSEQHRGSSSTSGVGIVTIP